MKHITYVPISGGGGLRGAAVLAGAEIGGVPIPPMMFGVSLLVGPVMFLRLVETLGQRSDVHVSWFGCLPFAAGKADLNFLKQPAVPIWILECGEGKVGATFRIRTGDTRIVPHL